MAHDSPEIVDKLFLKDLRESKYDIEDSAKGRRFVFPVLDTLNVSSV